MSVKIETKVRGFDPALAVLGRLARIDMTDLLDNVGQLIENQTKRRIQHDKEDADGNAWDPWSDSYAKTRHSGHSLLQNENHLLNSIQHIVTGDTLEVGSNVIYAATHQLGSDDGTIDARPYLGLSDSDQDEIEDIVSLWLEEQARL